MKKTYTFRTERGANVTLDVNAGFEVKKETVWVDGIAEEIDRTVWVQEIISMTVNGNTVNAKFDRVNNKTAAAWMIGNQKAAVIIPADIMSDIIEEQLEASKARAAADEKYIKDYNRVVNAMTLNGDTY